MLNTHMPCYNRPRTSSRHHTEVQNQKHVYTRNMQITATPPPYLALGVVKSTIHCMFHRYLTPSQVTAPARVEAEEGGPASIQYPMQMVLAKTKTPP